MYIRCSKCGKVIGERINSHRIEIRHGSRDVIIDLGRADILCDRCGESNVVLPIPKWRIDRAEAAHEEAMKMGAGKPLKEGVRE